MRRLGQSCLQSQGQVNLAAPSYGTFFDPFLSPTSKPHIRNLLPLTCWACLGSSPAQTPLPVILGACFPTPP